MLVLECMFDAYLASRIDGILLQQDWPNLLPYTNMPTINRDFKVCRTLLSCYPTNEEYIGQHKSVVILNKEFNQEYGGHITTWWVKPSHKTCKEERQEKITEGKYISPAFQYLGCLEEWNENLWKNSHINLLWWLKSCRFSTQLCWNTWFMLFLFNLICIDLISAGML